MASNANVSVVPNAAGGLGTDLLALARAEGSAGHPWRRDHALLSGAHSARNLADLVHHVALLHGSAPGLIDLVEGTGILGLLHQRMVQGFALERGYVAHLVVEVGPFPSTAGQAMSEAAVIGQRHAIETLARSGRVGCSCGAIAGLLLDWAAVRPMLDAAAVRYGVAAAPPAIPDPQILAATIDAAATDPALTRAVHFGARQMLLQHRGLWDLLEARAHARRED